MVGQGRRNGPSFLGENECCLWRQEPPDQSAFLHEPPVACVDQDPEVRRWAPGRRMVPRPLAGGARRGGVGVLKSHAARLRGPGIKPTLPLHESIGMRQNASACVGEAPDRVSGPSRSGAFAPCLGMARGARDAGRAPLRYCFFTFPGFHRRVFVS